MSLRIFDPSSGGETRSWRASACSASSRYFVCSANCTARPQIEEVRATRCRYARPQPRQTSASGRAGERRRGSPGSGRARAARRRSSSGRDHLVEQRLEPLGAARPSEYRGRLPPRRAPAARPSAGSSSSRAIAAASAAASPARPAARSRRRCRTSRIDGRSDATIGRPAAMYSNSFSGDVNRSRSRTRDSAAPARRAPQQLRDLRRLDQPGERHRDRQSRAVRAAAFTRARSGSAACPPTIKPVDVRHAARAPRAARRHLSTHTGARHRRRPAHA